MNLRNEYWISAVAAVVLVILGVVIFLGVQSKPGPHHLVIQSATASGSTYELVTGDRTAKSDLRNALTAEKAEYTDTQQYTSDTATLKGIETSLDWGGKLQVVVGTAMAQGDTVCMSEGSQSGTMFSIADIAAGPDAGTYYGETTCPTGAPASALAQWPSAWGGSMTTPGTAYVGGAGDLAQKCKIEGLTFETAVQAYRAQYSNWPAGVTAPDIAASLRSAGFLQSDRVLFDRAAASPRQYSWYYNPTTHDVDTSSC
jgi:hypothetical protein